MQNVEAYKLATLVQETTNAMNQVLFFFAHFVFVQHFIIVQRSVQAIESLPLSIREEVFRGTDGGQVIFLIQQLTGSTPHWMMVAQSSWYKIPAPLRPQEISIWMRLESKMLMPATWVWEMLVGFARQLFNLSTWGNARPARRYESLLIKDWTQFHDFHRHTVARFARSRTKVSMSNIAEESRSPRGKRKRREKVNALMAWHLQTWR